MESLLRRDTRKAGEDRLIDRLSECLIGQEMGIDCLFPVAGLHGKCFLVSQLVEMVFGIKRFHSWFKHLERLLMGCIGILFTIFDTAGICLYAKAKR